MKTDQFRERDYQTNTGISLRAECEQSRRTKEAEKT
jgi:hypothetical protein